MYWSYSGDPAASDKDKYRFLIGDTNQNDQLMQDKEIQFILDTYDRHNMRMYKMYEVIANKFSRDIKKTLGPRSEDPTGRAEYYSKLLNHYKALAEASYGYPLYGTPAKTIFEKGMHDND